MLLCYAVCDMNTGTQEKDAFADDWVRAKNYWLKFHRVYDYSYLFYKSVVTANAFDGEDFTRAFGMQVFVPLTFQTIEGLTAQVNRRRLRIKIASLTKRETARTKILGEFDNAEWQRANGDASLADAEKNAFIFGNGYLLNAFVEDKVSVHMPRLDKPGAEAEKPESSDDGVPDEEPKAEEETEKAPIAKRVEWDVEEKTLYFGMRPKALNPYYVFTDPNATEDADRGYVYLYVPMALESARDFVVSNGWMSKVDAEAKILPMQVERFDKIRDAIDMMYSRPAVGQWSRGDHVDPYDAYTAGTRSDIDRGEQVAFLMRYEADHFEVRLASANSETLYKDWNVYPHKQIPIVSLFDVKTPHEFRAQGEPEIMRWQQIATNRVENMQLSAMMISIVQRYAVRSDLIEDETDLLFYNPFRPIRLKALPGLTSASQAITPMPQLDVKDSAFKMLDRQRATAQATTGISDFIIGGNNAKTDTATESNNLLAAANARIAEKLRMVDEIAMRSLIGQWHSAIPFFYDTELEYRLFGADEYLMYLPYDRDEANEDASLVAAAATKLDAVGETLEEVYQNAGYKLVIFRSDIDEGFAVDIEVADGDSLEQKQFDHMNRILRTMVEVNDKMATASPNDPRRFDVFLFGKDILKNFPEVTDVDKYVIGETKKAAPAFPQGMPGGAMPPQAGPEATGATTMPPASPAAAPMPTEAPVAAAA